MEFSQKPIKATIILFCYNQKETVARAIESVLRQKCEYRYEILVADDGSSDRTRRVCEQYARWYPELFRILPPHRNKGIVDNYFDAIEAAEGEYVGDCAGDDEWLDPMRLQMQIEALDEDKSLTAVSTNTEAINEDTGKTVLMPGSMFKGERAFKQIKVNSQDVLRESLNFTDALPYVLSSALFRKQPVLDILRENKEILRCYDGGVEDVPLIAALASKGDLLHLPITGYKYYINGESASNNLPLEKEYYFVADTVNMVRRLGIYYGLKTRDQQSFFREKLTYLASRVHHADNPKLSEDLERRLKEWDLRIPLRARVHLLLNKYRR